MTVRVSAVPPPSTAVKAERLLNLVIALVNTPRFRPASWIRRHVAGYDASSEEAFNRMFERDKSELRDLGVPLQSDDEDGYRIPASEFSLPPLSFTPEETAAVGLAARLWTTTVLQPAGEQALRKLREASTDPAQPAGRDGGWFADGLLQPQVRTADPAFGPLQTATLNRRVVSFRYRKQPDQKPQQRRLQPWGLVSFRGRWYVIGHDLGRGQQRTFRISRIVGEVTVSGRAHAYEVPADVDLLEQVRRQAEPVAERSATVLVLPGRAAGLRRDAELLRAASADPADVDDASDELRIPIVGLWDTARKIAAAGADVLVVEPADLRDAVVRVLQGTAAAGEAGGG